MSIKRVPITDEFTFQLPVKDKDLSTPPGSPTKGDRYIVAATGSGAWTGQTGNIALCIVGGGSPSWEFVTKVEGMIVWIEDENLFYKYDGSNWLNLLGNFTELKLTQILLNIFLAFFKISVLGGLSKYNLIDGIMDEFEDETGIGTKTNATYNSTDDYYSPLISVKTLLDYMEYSSNELAQAAYVSNDTTNVYGSDFLTGGTASASSVQTAQVASYAVDNNVGTFWQFDENQNVPQWWKYDLGAGITKTARKLRLNPYRITTAYLQGSNNNSDWTNLVTISSPTGGEWTEYTFTNTTAYRYYRINITAFPGVPPSAIYELELMEVIGVNLQCFSEATIKQQGSYSLKGIAYTTVSLNDTLTRTVSPTIDLTGKIQIKFDIYSNRTGSNIKIGIHDSGGTTTEITPNITDANQWQTITWDISGIGNANKDVIDQIIITIVNADAENTFYIDNMYAGEDLTNNMTLISIATTAEVTPTKSRIVLFEEDVDGITINTDIKAYISRDNGTTFTQHTLIDEGDYDPSKKILSSEAIDISGQPSGTSMKWKVETLNNKNLKLHAVGVNWD